MDIPHEPEDNRVEGETLCSGAPLTRPSSSSQPKLDSGAPLFRERVCGRLNRRLVSSAPLPRACLWPTQSTVGELRPFAESVSVTDSIDGW